MVVTKTIFFYSFSLSLPVIFFLFTNYHPGREKKCVNLFLLLYRQSTNITLLHLPPISPPPPCVVCPSSKHSVSLPLTVITAWFQHRVVLFPSTLPFLSLFFFIPGSFNLLFLSYVLTYCCGRLFSALFHTRAQFTSFFCPVLL